MAVDPRGHVLPGQRLTLAASQVNALNAMIRQGAGMSGRGAGFIEPAGNIIMARNSTGLAVPRWGVMEISGIEIDPADGDRHEREFQELPCVTCVIPSDITNQFVVAVEPIENGTIGRVAVSGVVPAKLEVLNEDDTTCGPKNSVDELKTGGGQTEILWKQSGTGADKWALVRLGKSGVFVRLCKTTSDWELGTTATLDIWESGEPGSEGASIPSLIEGVVNKAGKVPAGQFVLIGKAGNGVWYLLNDRWQYEETLGTLAGRLGSDASESSSSDDVEAGSELQLLVNNAGCGKWVQTQKLQVLTGVSLVGTDLTFTAREVYVLVDAAPESEVVVDGTDCQGY